MVTSWADFLSKAKNEGESLGAAMKRLGKRWKGPLAAGGDPEYEYVKGPPSPAKAKSPRRSTKKRAPEAGRKSKRRSKRTIRGAGRSQAGPGRASHPGEGSSGVRVVGASAGAQEALAGAVDTFMRATSLGSGDQGKVVVLVIPRS